MPPKSFRNMVQGSGCTPFSRLVARRMYERVEKMENDRAGMPAQQNVVTAIPIGTHPVSLVLVQCHYLFSKSVFGEFPAAILRFSVCGLAVVALVFQSGKIVVNGVRTDMQIIYVMHLVYDMLKNAGALHASSFVCVITVSNRVFTGRTANVVNLERLRTLMSNIDHPDNVPLASAHVAQLVLETGVTDALRRLYVFYFGHIFRKGELPPCLLMTARAAALRKHFRNSAPVAARCNKWTSSSSGGGGGDSSSGSNEDDGFDSDDGGGGGGRRRTKNDQRPRKRPRRGKDANNRTDADEADEFREDGAATWLPTRTYNERVKRPKVVIPASGIINILNCSNTDDAQCVYWYMLRILDSVHMHRDDQLPPCRRSDDRSAQRRATLGRTLRVAPAAPQHVLDAARTVAEHTPIPTAHWTIVQQQQQQQQQPTAILAGARAAATAAPVPAMARTLEFRADNTVRTTPWTEQDARGLTTQQEYVTVRSATATQPQQPVRRR